MLALNVSSLGLAVEAVTNGQPHEQLRQNKVLQKCESIVIKSYRSYATNGYLIMHMAYLAALIYMPRKPAQLLTMRLTAP